MFARFYVNNKYSDKKLLWAMVWSDIIFDEKNLILIRRFVGRNTFSEFSKVRCVWDNDKCNTCDIEI